MIRSRKAKPVKTIGDLCLASGMAVKRCKATGCEKTSEGKRNIPAHKRFLFNYCSYQCYQAFLEENRKGAKARVAAYLEKKAKQL